MVVGKKLIIVVTAMVLVSAGILGALVLMNPTPEDTSISARIDTPTDGATVTGVINITASTTSAKAINYTNLWMDGTLLGNKSSAPYYWNLNTTHYPEGQHVLNFTAKNTAGKKAHAEITITINNGGTTVGITNPTNNTKVNGTVAIVSQVVSPRGISHVAFSIDGAEMGNLSAAPFTFDLDTTVYANGIHNITVAVEDEIGMRGHAFVAVFVDNPFNITDGRGIVVHFSSTPVRIITLGSSFTEVLYAMGADELIVGVDNSSNYPEAAKSKPHVGGSSSPNQETITSLSPDCIIVWSYNTNLITTLEAKHYTVIGFNPKSVVAVETAMRALGNLTAKSVQANSMVSSMEARIDAVADQLASVPMDQRPWVYYEQANGRTAGIGTLANDIISRAGGRNICNVSGNPTLTSEFIVDANPGFIIVDNASQYSNADIAARSGWYAISAVQNDHIYRIDSRMMSLTPRLVDALEQMVEWFYPT